MSFLKHTLILLVIPFLMLSGCSKDDDDLVNRTLLQGQWRVSLFVDNGNDETTHFTGYRFTFNDNGVVTAVRSEVPSTVTGSFSSGGDDSRNKLILNFGSTPLFNELNDDWKIVDQSNSRVRLEHVSSSGGTDLLTLERL